MLGRWPCETALGARAQFPERLFPLRTVSCPSAGTVSAVSVTTRRVLPVLQANHPTWGGPEDPTRPAAPPHCLEQVHYPGVSTAATALLPGLFLRLLSGHLFMDKLRLSPTRQGPGTRPPGARSCRHTLPQSQERKSSHPGRSFRRQQTDPAVILCEVPTTTMRR